MRLPRPRRMGLLLGFVTTAAAATVPLPEDRSVLQEPWTVRLNNGQEILGRLAGTGRDTLRFRRVLEGGEVTISLGREEIESLTLPGREWVDRARDAVRAGNWNTARDLLAALYDQRGAVLDLLPAGQTDLLSFLPRAQLATGATAAAVSTAEDLQAVATRPTTLARLREIRLLGHYRLQLDEEARNLARAERAEGPRYRDSALPDLVLALLDWQAGRVEEALEECLRPIVFSGSPPPRYLSTCYALAVIAAREIGDEELGTILDAERRERGLPWRPPPGLPGEADPLEGRGGTPPPRKPPSPEIDLPYVPVVAPGARAASPVRTRTESTSAPSSP